MSTVTTVLRGHAERRPDAPAVIYAGRTLSFGELYRRSVQVAAVLLGAGVAAGDRVAHLDKSSPEFFELLLGAAGIGAVLVPLNWRLAPAELAAVINDAGVRIILVGREFVATAGELAVDTVVVLGDDYETRLQAVEPWAGPERATAESVVIQAYTSGTTGEPKGVMITHANFGAEIGAYDEFQSFEETSVALAVLPLFHVAGVLAVFGPLWYGVACVLHREMVPSAVLADIAEHRVTHMVVVPAVLQALVASEAIVGADVSSLRTIAYGASPISETLLERAMSVFGCDFLQAYGLTETSGMATCLSPADHRQWQDHPQRLRSAGKPVAGVELRIVDPGSGAAVASGQVGEVWLRGAIIMAGYWRRAAETSHAITDDGWSRTGDAGYVDDDGYLYIHDRIKDMIISGGENVYSTEVENVLMAHPGVADATVIGVPDERWGEAVKAVVVRVAGSKLTAPELLAWCRQRLAGYKCPASVDWIDVLPRNPSGKVLKRILRQPYWASQSRLVN